jgi:hypothetical protein
VTGLFAEVHAAAETRTGAEGGILFEMSSPLGGKEKGLEELCRRYQVRRLYLFGSALRADFDFDRSDLDFLVEFDEPPDGRAARQYFGLLGELRVLFGRPVDLVDADAIRNPWFRKSLEATRRELFAA